VAAMANILRCAMCDYELGTEDGFCPYCGEEIKKPMAGGEN